jgi:hypothetical protein
MQTKSIARICGVLYIVTVLAFLVSNLVLKAQLVDAEDIPGTFNQIADHTSRYRLAVSIDFLAMVGVMALAFSLYTILRPVNPYWALLALGWRIGEVILQAGAKVPDYLLLDLSKSAAAVSGSEIADMERLGDMLMNGSMLALALSFVFFSGGSLVNNFLFYKSKAIPAALAIFGLLAAGLYALGSLFLIAGLAEGTALGLMLPLVLFELSLGLYLTGFGIKEEASRSRVIGSQ